MGLTTASRALADSVDGPRFLVKLMTLAAAIGLAMLVIGVYGVLSFAVSQRSRDLGVHIALGADTGALKWKVVREGLAMAESESIQGRRGREPTSPRGSYIFRTIFPTLCRDSMNRWASATSSKGNVEPTTGRIPWLRTNSTRSPCTRRRRASSASK